MTPDMRELEEFVSELSKFRVTEIEVPRFCIPDFPEDLHVKIRLGWRSFVLPIQSKETKLMVLEKCTAYVRFEIDAKGVIAFNGKIPFVPVWNRFQCSSDTAHTYGHNAFGRAQSLVLFEQFKEEMFKKTIISLKQDRDSEKELAILVARAFKPFIPYGVARRLEGK